MKSLRVLFGAIVIAYLGFSLGGIHAATAGRPNSRTYSVGFGNAAWIRAPGQGSVTFFRDQFSLAAHSARATLAVQADQVFAVWVNGTEVAKNLQAARSGLPNRAQVVDVTRELSLGANSIGIQAMNLDNRVPRVRAHLLLTSASGSFDLVTSSQWEATSDAWAAKPLATAGLPAFSKVTFPATGWSQARVVTEPGDTGQSIVPVNVLQRDFSGNAIATAPPQSDFVAEGDWSLPWTPSDGWIRVVTTATYTLGLDGHKIFHFSQVSPPLAIGGGAAQVQVLDLGPWFHRGTNVVSIHIADETPTALYLDGVFWSGNKSIAFSTGPTWRTVPSTDVGVATGVPWRSAARVGSVESVFPGGIQELVVSKGQFQTPRGPLSPRLVGALIALAVWLIVALMAWRARLVGSWASAMLALALGALPALLCVEIFFQLARLSISSPPFPYEGSIFDVLLLVAVIGPAAALAEGWRQRNVTRGRGPGAGNLIEVTTQGSSPLAPMATGTAFSRTSSIAGRWMILRAPTGLTIGRGGVLSATTHSWGGTRRLTSIIDEWRVRYGVTAAIFGILAVMVSLLTYKIRYEPLWQDETASLYAAKAMRAHYGLPRLPSGLLYFKGELYHGLLAFASLFVGWNTSDFRLLSVLWYAATVLAFGFLLLPTLFPGRKGLTVIATLLFATAPQELTWARDIRMYQQAQFFSVLAITFLYRAITTSRRRDIALTSLSIVAMYLSHEETFVFFPAIAVCVLVFGGRRALTNKAWWIWGGLAIAIIGLQYALTTIHLPGVGIDSSNRPYVQWDTRSFFYYLGSVYFPRVSHGGVLTFVSSAAVIGTITGLVRRERARLFLAVTVWVTVLCLSTIFTAKIGRYTFVTLPPLFCLAVLGAADVIRAARRLVHTAGARLQRSQLIVATACAALGTVWLGMTLTGGPRDYGLAAARLTGSTYTHHHADWQVAASYIKDHLQPGDAVGMLATPGPASWYLGRSPDFIIPSGAPRLIYIVVNHGHLTDTVYGSPLVLDSQSLLRIMATHRRVWLVTDPGSDTAAAPVQMRPLLRQFAEVEYGYGNSVFLWTS